MAAAVMPHVPKSRPRRRYDNRFFSGMLALLLITVFVGFARTYFLAGVLSSKTSVFGTSAQLFQRLI